MVIYNGYKYVMVFKQCHLLIKCQPTLGQVKRFTELKSKYMLSNKKYCKEYE